MNKIIELSSDDEDNIITTYDYITAQSIKDSVLSSFVSDFFETRLIQKDSLALIYKFLLTIINASSDKADEIFLKLETNPRNLEILKKIWNTILCGWKI